MALSCAMNPRNEITLYNVMLGIIRVRVICQRVLNSKKTVLFIFLKNIITRAGHSMFIFFEN